MKRYAFLLLMIWGILAVGCNNDHQLQEQNLPRNEKNVEEIKLLEALDSFNATLSEQLNLPRQYDKNTNRVINKPQTRAASAWDIFVADAEGAYKGSKKGKRYGIWGRIAGAIIYGGVASGIEYLNGELDEAFSDGGVEDISTTAMSEMIQNGTIFNADSLYNLGVNVETVYVGTAEETIGDDIDPLANSVGIGHNLILTALLAPQNGYSTNNNGGTETGGGSDGGELDVSFADMYGDNISADLLSNDVFQEDFADFVTICLQKEQGDIPLDEDETVSDTVMNLFLEAASFCNTPGELLNSVVDYYETYINNSTALTLDEKEDIYMGMIVAVYSINFWNNHNDNSGSGETGSGEDPNPDGSSSEGETDGNEEEGSPENDNP